MLRARPVGRVAVRQYELTVLRARPVGRVAVRQYELTVLRARPVGPTVCSDQLLGDPWIHSVMATWKFAYFLIQAVISF